MNRREALRRAGFAAGAAVMTPALLTLFQSCQEESRPNWNPEFLEPAEAETLTAFVATLLPATDTPGGLDVKVDVFLDKVMARTYSEEAKAGTRRELAAFNGRAVKQFGKGFAELPVEDQQAFLREEEKAGGKYNPGVWGTTVGEQEPVSFYRGLKSMVIWGYLSSEQIGTEVLRYDPVPGEYLGCVSLEEGERSWSL